MSDTVTVVERMARAIAAARSNTDKALAALEALRVPSEGMLKAMYGKNSREDFAVVALNDHINALQWQRAIDAAISEHKERT